MSSALKLNEFYHTLHEIQQLDGILALLDWDLHVMIPSNGVAARAKQEELVSRLIHQRLTDSSFVAVVNQLAERIGELNEDEQVNVRETKRLIDRAQKLPQEFVAEKSRTCSLSYSRWLKAREENDFREVEPFLEKLVHLSQQEAELVGYDEHPYDALLDYYEPYARLSQIKPLLLSLAERLQKLIPAIMESYPPTEAPPPSGVFPLDRQHLLCTNIARAFGFDFQSGRLDTTVHPFASQIAIGDVRITTRFDEKDFFSALYSTMHETGHALYDSGLPEKHQGTPRGRAISLGVHESQSRLWENLIGRSFGFCIFLYNQLQDIFPEFCRQTNAERVWRSVNRVEPSLIRVEADEVTYSLHIVIRTLLEEELVSGTLSVQDLPEAWNSYYKKYLGITPDCVRNGALQDIHWYQGSFGYFPTYVLGNLYGALLLEVLNENVPNLEQNIAQGHFSAIRNWLNENVYQYGMKYSAIELIKRITGKDLSEQPFVDYIARKFNV